MRQFVYTMFITNNHDSFQLWWKEKSVKHQKVSKFCHQDCSFRFCLIFIFNKKEPQSLSICHLLRKGSVWVFNVTNRRTGFCSFQSFHKLVIYLFNSLAKSFTLFWKYSQTVKEISLFFKKNKFAILKLIYFQF